MTGIAPQALAAAPLDVLDEMIEIHAERLRTGYHQTELLAALVEIQHVQLRLMIGAYTKSRPPDPLRLERPRREEPAEPVKTDTWKTFARALMTRGGSNAG